MSVARKVDVIHFHCLVWMLLGGKNFVNTKDQKDVLVPMLKLIAKNLAMFVARKVDVILCLV